MIALDSFLLNRVFSPVVWWIEHKTGKTNFRQAEVCIYASMALMVVWVSFLIWHSRIIWLTAPMMTLCAAGWIFVCFQGISILRSVERFTLQYGPMLFDSLPNIYRPLQLISYWVIGDIILMLDVHLLHGWTWVVAPSYWYTVPMAIATYLRAVPRPPARKEKCEARDWFSFLRPVPVPT